MTGGVAHRVKQKFSGPAEAAFVGLLVAAAEAEQRLDAVCADHGITHVQYNVLRILRGAHPGGHPRFEIADRLMTRAPDVTRLLDRLERQGLVERGTDPSNRRQSIARITPAGRELLRTLDPGITRVRDRMLARLSADQLRRLRQAFDAMLD